MMSAAGQQNNDVQEFVCNIMGLKSRKMSRRLDAVEIKNATNTFRWLRNNSPRLDDSSKCQLLDLGLIETCSRYCDNFFANEPLSQSVLLQFLANFSVGHESAQRQIFGDFCDMLRYIVLPATTYIVNVFNVYSHLSNTFVNTLMHYLFTYHLH